MLGFNRSSHRDRAIRNDQTMLRGRIRELAAARVRYGYFRIYILLHREGWNINHKRVYRLYRQEGLSMRLRKLTAPREGGAPRGPACGRGDSIRSRSTSAGRGNQPTTRWSNPSMDGCGTSV